MSMKRYRRIILMASAIGIFGASAAVSALASSSPGAAGGSESMRPSQAQPAGGVAAPNAEHVGAFAAFRRDATALDQLPAHDQDALKTLQSSQATAQANPSLARNVYAGENGSVFLVPGAGMLCLLVNGNAFGWASTCATNAQAIAGGIGFVYYSTAPSGQISDVTIVGALPDGARDVNIVDDAGNATPLPLSQDNGYWAAVANAAKMTWRTPDGMQHSTPLPQAHPSSEG